jgi:hypothetical protein
MIEQSVRLQMELLHVRGTEYGTVPKTDRVVSGYNANDHKSPQSLNQTCIESL